MARRRIVRPEEKEEVEKKAKPSFVPPKFDETEFLQTENRSAKMIYISLGMSLIAAIFSFFMMRVLFELDVSSYRTIPIIVPIICVPIGLFLFTRFGIDLKKLEKKKYFENAFMYAAAWVALFLISMNPPLSDLSEPHISDVVVRGTNIDGDEVWYLDEPVTAFPDVNGSDVKSLEVYCLITDNWKLDEVRITVQMLENNTWVDALGQNPYEISVDKVRNNSDLRVDGDSIKRKHSEIMKDSWYGDDWDNWKDNLHRVTFGNLTSIRGEVEFRISYYARDIRDNSIRKEFTFKVGSD